MPTIHPTALVDGGAVLADDVEIGPYCLVESDVTLGPGTVLRGHAIVRRYTTLGRGNVVDSFVVLGGEPQDRNFDAAQITYLTIGDDNIFREGVTISRATGDGNVTRIGSRGHWMTQSHAAHNCQIGDDVVLVNNVGLAGYSELGPRVLLSGCAGVHQFTWVGEGAMAQANTGISSHVPPFCMVTGINSIIGLNVVGLRRAEDVGAEDLRQIKEAFRMLYRSGLTPPTALERMDACTDWGPPAGRFRAFLRRVLTAEGRYKRALCAPRGRAGRGA